MIYCYWSSSCRDKQSEKTQPHNLRTGPKTKRLQSGGRLLTGQAHIRVLLDNFQIYMIIARIKGSPCRREWMVHSKPSIPADHPVRSAQSKDSIRPLSVGTNEFAL